MELLYVHRVENKLAKLRRHASRIHFASSSFGPIHFVLEHFKLYTLGFGQVGRLVQLNVDHFFIVTIYKLSPQFSFD